MAITPRLMGAGFGALQAKGIVGTVTSNLIAGVASTPIVYDELNVFWTVPSGGACRLRADLGYGDLQAVCNLGAFPLTVLPPVGGAMNGGAINAGYVVQPSCTAVFQCIDGVDFITPGTGNGATLLGGTFTLANATSTVVSIPGMLATSRVFWCPSVNSPLAAQMLPFLYYTAKAAGSITFAHPTPTGTCAFDYEVRV